MKTFILLLGISFGGAMGSVLRHSVGFVGTKLLGVSPLVPTMIVNVLGCFLIGVVFFLIESTYNRDLPSRLVRSKLAAPLQSRGWWPQEDATAPVFREFEADLRAQMWSGLLITGFMGGLTTFSLFSLISLQLQQEGDLLGVLINIVGTVVLGFIATYLGLRVGQSLALSRNPQTPDDQGKPRSE